MSLSPPVSHWPGCAPHAPLQYTISIMHLLLESPQCSGAASHLREGFVYIFSRLWQQALLPVNTLLGVPATGCAKTWIQLACIKPRLTQGGWWFKLQQKDTTSLSRQALEASWPSHRNYASWQKRFNKLRAELGMQEETLQARVREGHLPSFRAYVKWSI